MLFILFASLTVLVADDSRDLNPLKTRVFFQNPKIGTFGPVKSGILTKAASKFE